MDLAYESSDDDNEFPGFEKAPKKKAVSEGPNPDWQLMLIKSFEKKDVHGKAFTMYEIRVISDTASTWRIYRRYSQFAKLHSALKKQFPARVFNLPPKKLFGSMDKAFISARRSGLSSFLIELLGAPDVLKSSSVASFLDPNSNPSFALLLAPDKEGFLTKRAQIRKMVWKRRWFVIKDATFYYFKGFEDADPRGIIPINMSTVELLPDSADRKYAFKIKSKDPTKPSWYLSADTEDERQEWVNALRGANAERRGNSGLGRSSFSGNDPGAGEYNPNFSYGSPSALGNGQVSLTPASTGSIVPSTQNSLLSREQMLLSSSARSTGSLASHSKSYDKVMALINERDTTEGSQKEGANSDSDIEFSDGEEDPIFAPTLSDPTEPAAASGIDPAIKATLIKGAKFSQITVDAAPTTRHVHCSEGLDYLLWETPGSQGQTLLMPFREIVSIKSGPPSWTYSANAKPSEPSKCFHVETQYTTLALQAQSAELAQSWKSMIEAVHSKLKK